MKPTILFACPQSAAKSVHAAADFQQRVQRRAIDIEAAFGGIDPNPDIVPAVTAVLASEEIVVSQQHPRSLSQVDIDTANIIVALSCPFDQFDLSKTLIEEWNNVAAPGQKFQAARSMIIAHGTERIGTLRQEAK